MKHQHRKVENQIKMAKMVLMNELNKQANGLIEELEVYVDRWVRWMGSVHSLGQKPGSYQTSSRVRAAWAGIQRYYFHSSLPLPRS